MFIDYVYLYNYKLNLWFSGCSLTQNLIASLSFTFSFHDFTR